MKKRLPVLIIALLVVLFLTTFSAASAESNAPIVCSVDMSWNGAYWAGAVDGCILEGSIRFVPDPDKPAYVVGNALHFFELFTIDPDSGGKISGTTAGVGHMNQPPFQFMANGWVTGATGSWAHLIGNKYFEMGLAVPTPDPNFPLTVEEMVLRIVPANNPN